MRIAVVGAGVSGLGAAYALSPAHQVTLFESEPRLGGHAHTVTIDYDGEPIDVDTGFIVFNGDNYPNLTGLFDELRIETFETDMSFAVSDAGGYEWSSNGLNGIFSWRRNLLRPEFLSMLGEVVRFSARARADIGRPGALSGQTLEAYVRSLGLGRRFREAYLFPMGAAIWSMPERDMLDYPAETFLRFFDNHRLLHANRPKWRSVKGGSRVYVERLAGQLGDRVRAGVAVTGVRRLEGGVEVRTADGAVAAFDHVLFACHSDQALRLLTDARPRERALLGAVRYAPNVAWLHRDPGLMPKRRSAWASWNVLRLGASDAPVCVSYWMNSLQGLPADKPLFVTLNPPRPPQPHMTFGRYEYAHPQFDRAAIEAQRGFDEIQGKDRVSFAGAWLGYGFHEDGLASGLAAAARFVTPPAWAKLPSRHKAAAAVSAAA